MTSPPYLLPSNTSNGKELFLTLKRKPTFLLFLFWTCIFGCFVFFSPSYKKKERKRRWKRRKHRSQHILFDALFVSKKARQSNAFLFEKGWSYLLSVEKLYLLLWYQSEMAKQNRITILYFKSFLKIKNHFLHRLVAGFLETISSDEELQTTDGSRHP